MAYHLRLEFWSEVFIISDNMAKRSIVCFVVLMVKSEVMYVQHIFDFVDDACFRIFCVCGAGSNNFDNK